MRNRPLTLVLTASFVLATFSLASCARPVRSGGPGPRVSGDGDSVISTPVPPGTISSVQPPMRPVMVPVTPGMVDVRPIPWIKSVPSADGRTLTLLFWGSPCLGVDHVSVDEGSSRIVATLYVGTPPSKVGSVCPNLAVLNGVRVALSDPLGSRTVVDGAAHPQT